MVNRKDRGAKPTVLSFDPAEENVLFEANSSVGLRLLIVKQGKLFAVLVEVGGV
jgi:hypothetical protein